MPKWTTHTEGGHWYGGGTDVRDCGQALQDAITAAFNGFIDGPCLDCFPGLRDCLKKKWNEVEIDCTDPACDQLDGRQSGDSILLCISDRPRLDAVLLHELVHVCGGTELDSEAVEFACFAGNGDTTPFGDDWDKFKSETSALGGNEKERVGEWVIWNSDTGEVWGKVVEGGSWYGGGTTKKGSRCFQSDDFKHTYGGGGGGGSWY